MFVLAFELNSLLNDRERNFQEGRRRLNQLLMMHGTMAIFGKFLEDMTDTSLSTDHGVTWNAQPLSQGICGLEANAVNVEGQAIGILLDPGNGFVAIGLVNADGAGRTNAMGVQEDHDLADDLLRRPGFHHPLFAFGTNAVEFCQALGCLLNDVKDFFPKGLD